MKKICMVLDENENILEEKTFERMKDVTDWFWNSYNETLTGDGDCRFPSWNERYAFVQGEDVEYTFTDCNGLEVTRKWRLVYGVNLGDGNSYVKVNNLEGREREAMCRLCVRDSFEEDDRVSQEEIDETVENEWRDVPDSDLAFFYGDCFDRSLLESAMRDELKK